MEPWPNTPRHNAVAACLQFFWPIDPDSSRMLAIQIIETIERVVRREAAKERAAT
jgi:hypothetical protein